MIRVDLHTHSEASKDGGITPEQYADLLRNEKLDVIAITDHDRIDFAKGMQKALGKDFIIVGQEITTNDGDIIGLYLTEPIESGLSVAEAITEIKSQGGLVYIPHPFEKVRKGISQETLNNIIEDVDIIETNNGRAVTKKYNIEAETFAVKNRKLSASSSDAHGIKGIGHSYTILQNRPSKETLLIELENASFVYKRPPITSYLYPKYNTLVKFLKGQG